MPSEGEECAEESVPARSPCAGRAQAGDGGEERDEHDDEAGDEG